MKKNIKTDKDAWQYNVIDKKTRQRLKFVTWADDDTGEYGVIRTDIDGQVILNEKKELTIDVRKGDIKLEKIR